MTVVTTTNPADFADFRLIQTMRNHPSRQDARWQALHAEYVERFGSSFEENDAPAEFRTVTPEELEDAKSVVNVWRRRTAALHGVELKLDKPGAFTPGWYSIPETRLGKKELEQDDSLLDSIHDLLLDLGSVRTERQDVFHYLTLGLRISLTDGAWKFLVAEGQREGWLRVTQKTSWNGKVIGHRYAHVASVRARANAKASKRETQIEDAKTRLQFLADSLLDPNVEPDLLAKTILKLNAKTDDDELAVAIERLRAEHGTEQQKAAEDQKGGQWWDGFAELEQTWIHQRDAREVAEKLIDRIVAEGAPKYLPGHYVAHLVQIHGRWEIRLQRFDRTQSRTLDWSVADARDSLKRTLPDTRIVLASYALVTAPNVARKMRTDRIDSETRPKS